MHPPVLWVTLTLAGPALTVGSIVVGGYLTYRNQSERQALEQKLSDADRSLAYRKEQATSAELDYTFGQLYHSLGHAMQSEPLTDEAFNKYYKAIIRRAAAFTGGPPQQEEVNAWNLLLKRSDIQQVSGTWQKLGDGWMRKNNELVDEANTLREKRHKLERMGDRTVYVALSLQILGLIGPSLRDLLKG